VRWLVRAPEITQLPVDVPVRRVMERPWIVDAFFVPALNFIGNQGGLFQSYSIEQRIDLCGCGRIR
jgi:hypothetical protein